MAFRLRKGNVFVVLAMLFTHFLMEFLGLYAILFFERDYFTEFDYPASGDVCFIVESKGEDAVKEALYQPHVNISIANAGRCSTGLDGTEESGKRLRIVYLVKSTVGNFERRKVIRMTWGHERRFSDVPIRTLFLLGSSKDPDVERKVREESNTFHDLVVGEFEDTYFNNTLKTLMGLKWAHDHCPDSRFYLFVDDDYYVSTRNILRFLRNPTNYPGYLEDPVVSFEDYHHSRKQRSLQQQLVDFDLPDDVELYTGFLFFSKPLRQKLSKWYVSIQDYPFHYYPPYISGGAYILSNMVMNKFYLASYFVKPFLLDDIYLGIMAKKCGIEPFHSEYFLFYRRSFDPEKARYVVASHGFSDPQELKKVWMLQKQSGNA